MWDGTSSIPRQPLPNRVSLCVSLAGAVRMSLISHTTWRFHILPYCDLDVLLALNRTNRMIRALLNDPDVVCEWLHMAWYVRPRGCPCDRRLFLLDLDRWLPFTWDFRGGNEFPCTEREDGLSNLREMQLVLRRYGRSIPMMYQSQDRSFRVPPIRYPYEQQSDFNEGIYSCDTPCILVPLPRMVNVPVEATKIQSDPVPRLLFSPTTLDWGQHHEVTNDMMDRVYNKYDLPEKWNTQENGPIPDSAFRYVDPVDPLTHYLKRCEQEGLNPNDPNEDTDFMEGYHATQWARRTLYESAVGLDQFPGNICVHRDDLCGLAFRSGPTYIERRFVSHSHYGGVQGEAEYWGMHGLLMFTGVRYENEEGDFATWCLHTMSVLHATYLHGWNDLARMWLRGIRSNLVTLTGEIEQDFPLGSMVDVWRKLQSSCFMWQPMADIPTASSSPPLTVEEQRRSRRHQAMVFLLDSVYRSQYEHLQRVVKDFIQTPYHRRAQRDFRGVYLRSLLPNEDHWLNVRNYPETALCSDIEHMLRISEFILEFSEKVAPRVHPRVRATRRRVHRLHLNTACSLLLWAPHWTRPFSGTHLGSTVGMRYLNVDITHNHRYRYLLNFLNQRTLFHHAHPEDWHDRNVDIGRILRA